MALRKELLSDGPVNGAPVDATEAGVVCTSGADDEDSDAGTDGETYSIDRAATKGGVGSSGHDCERKARDNINH